MATSGSNYYSPDGGRLKLILSWSRIQTDITNNRSKIKLTLQLAHSGTGVWFSAKKSGVLHGQSFTYSGGFSGTGTKTLRTRELWVNHNADGTKSITFNASFNIAITYRGKRLNSMSTSVTANIDRIPRASSINSFSIASHLKPSTANTVNLSLSRATSSFTHDIELRDGSTVIQKWTGQGTPKTLSLSSSSVNTLLNRMRSVTSRQLTLRVQTKSGSSVIGTTTRNATTYVDSSVKPSVSGLTTSSSTGAKFDNAYVQSHSKLTGSYSSSATGGATIQSESITVKRNDDVMVINGTSGTTSRPFKYDGVYEVIASTTDSRGRTSTAKTEINVLSYFVPEINVFDVIRRANAPTIVEYKFNVNVAQYARGDYAGVTIERKSNGLAWEEVYSNTIERMNNDFTGTFTGNSVDTSYSFRITVEDLVGAVTSSTVTVSTQRVVLDIHKNEGVGIGKIHEHGVLDVDGTARFGHSNFNTEGKVPIIIQVNQGSDRTGVLRGVDPNGTVVWQIGNRMLNSRALYLEANSRIRMVSNRIEDGDGNQLVESGSNANGEWVKFYDGTAINIIKLTVSTNDNYVGLPLSYINTDYSIFINAQESSKWASGVQTATNNIGGAPNHSHQLRLLRFGTSENVDITITTIGRWK